MYIYWISLFTTTVHKEGEQLEDRRRVGASSSNSGNETGQRVQSLMFMMMMISLLIFENIKKKIISENIFLYLLLRLFKWK